MKAPFHTMILSLAVLGTFPASPLPAASTKVPATIYPVSNVWLSDGSNEIQPGVPEATVQHRLGAPLYKLTKTMCVYHRFAADREEAKERDCHNLLITYDSTYHVKSIKLINDEALAALTKMATANPAALAAAGL